MPHPIMTSTMSASRLLVDRFLAFCDGFPGAEIIDRLPIPAGMTGKRADVFFEDRRVVCEVKSLETDTSGKIDQILKPYRTTPEWPLFYGKWHISRVLKHLKDGPRLSQKIGTAVTSAVAEQAKSANRQIRETKAAYQLPASEGFLVVLNESIDVISPELLAGELNHQMNKKLSDGSARYPHLQSAMAFVEAHLIEIRPDFLGYPALICENGLATPSSWMKEFVDGLQAEWAEFNGVTSLDADIATLGSPTRTLREIREASGRIPRHEAWRLSYRTRPYLRPLSDGALFAKGREIMDDLAPRFLKNAPPTPREEMNPKMERWTHFIEEIAFRGIDLRVWGPHVSANLRKKSERADSPTRES